MFTLADLRKTPDNIVQEKAGYSPSGDFGRIRVEANPLLNKGYWLALDKDRNPIAVGAPGDQNVIVPGNVCTLVCSPELVVDLSRVFNGGS